MGQRPPEEVSSVQASTRDGKLSIRGVDGSAYHTHGGASAKLGDASFVIHSGDTHAHTVTVSSVEFLEGSSCTEPPTRVAAHPAYAGLFAERTGQRESTKTIVVKPGVTLPVSVGFEPAIEAYYTYCDRFAFRVRFSVDGDSVLVVAETVVTREDP